MADVRYWLNTTNDEATCDLPVIDTIGGFDSPTSRDLGIERNQSGSSFASIRSDMQGVWDTTHVFDRDVSGDDFGDGGPFAGDFDVNLRVSFSADFGGTHLVYARWKLQALDSGCVVLDETALSSEASGGWGSPGHHWIETVALDWPSGAERLRLLIEGKTTGASGPTFFGYLSVANGFGVRQFVDAPWQTPTVPARLWQRPAHLDRHEQRRRPRYHYTKPPFMRPQITLPAHGAELICRYPHPGILAR